MSYRDGLAADGLPAMDPLPGVRFSGLDRLRGLAIVLMVLDHVLFATGELVALRLTLTRASLPLFCLVAGSLAYRGLRSYRRLWRVAVAGVVATFLAAVIGMVQPDVLLVLALGLGVVNWSLRRGTGVYLVVFCAAIIQPITWRLADWQGYQLGTVVALLMVGMLIPPPMLARFGTALPGYLGAVGGHPLAWYLGHLVLLAVAVSL